jgi:hypothetical protein
MEYHRDSPFTSVKASIRIPKAKSTDDQSTLSPLLLFEGEAFEVVLFPCDNFTSSR